MKRKWKEEGPFMNRVILPTHIKKSVNEFFFSYDDKISMSIEYYDPEADSNKAPYPGIQKSLSNGGGVNVNGGIDSSGECDEKDSPTTSSPNTNPNKRYLECPGSVKVQHLKKFITMKYGLNEDFLVSKYVLSRRNSFRLIPILLINIT